MHKQNHDIFDDESKTSECIIMKHGVNMHQEYVTKSVKASVDVVIDDVITCKIMSSIWTALTCLISKLERRIKVKNVRNAFGYFDSIRNCRWYFQRKSSPGPQNFDNFKNL